MVFLDIGMPDQDGSKLLRELRSLPGCDTTFAVAVTGYDADHEKAGWVDFRKFDARLQKPVELADLTRLLDLAKVRSAVP